MKFNSAEDMLKFIQNGNDLWSPSAGIYVFVYNDDGAICTYRIDKKQAEELSVKAEYINTYWSSFLGFGGSIYDEPENLKLCEELCKTKDWVFALNIHKIQTKLLY